jgi:hypothetical protein
MPTGRSRRSVQDFFERTSVLTVMLLLSLVALALTVAAACARAPLYAAVLVLAVMELLRALPLGR